MEVEGHGAALSRDVSFCAGMLPRVSRTFALGIEGLSPRLREPVRVAYLLCRIADSIEDQTTLPAAERRSALAAWQGEVLVAAGGADDGEPLGVPGSFLVPLPAPPSTGAFGRDVVGTSADDAELVRGRERVLAVFRSLPWDARQLIAYRVVEMCRGMSEMLPGDGASPRLATVEELDRYCYFVAGTVGHVLTGLFLAGAGADAADAAVTRELAALAPRFGIGLQLVNVVKDAASDLEEGRCFVPRALWPDERDRDGFARALVALCARAHGFLDDADRYVLTLPSTLEDARRFCALPLLLARRSLRACERSTHLADPTRPVKVTREEVAEAFAWVARHATDDDALRRRLTAER